MASILDRYGIKEVCDFTFYELKDGKPDRPVLFLDSLKVSTIEQTGEQVDSRGGKGNVILMSWDTNKEINVTIEDALFSPKSMAIMFGNGKVQTYSGTQAYIMKTEQFKSEGNTMPSAATSVGEGKKDGGWNQLFTDPNGKQFLKINPKFYDETGNVIVQSGASDGQVNWTSGQTYFCSYDLLVSGSVIDINANTFPGTYYCVGDTFVRNKDGKDEFFQFVIPKAKVQSENTITLEADGDPSTFNMSLKVMRPDDGAMMKLVKYDLAGNHLDVANTVEAPAHNHVLTPVTPTNG